MQQRESIASRAHGLWPSILPRLGVPEATLNKRKHGPCPICGGRDRFRFTDYEGTGAFYCNQCRRIGPVDMIMHINGWDFAKAAKEIEAEIGDPTFRPANRKFEKADGRSAMQRLWDTCTLIRPGDFVDRYLADRGVRQGTYSRWMRKADSAKHETGDGDKSWHPAMVCKIIAPDGTPTNLHRTYLTLDGRKADVLPVRKTMWGAIVPGSAIRLFEAGPVIGVAEGIETALAASHIFRIPVWAAINTTMLANWEPPAEARQVVVCGDNDPKFGGQAAATALAHRLACRGTQVEVRIPERTGSDWNDVLLAGRQAA